MIKKEFLRMAVADLIPYDRNPRNIPEEAIDAVRESVRQCGDGVPLDPIEIDEDNVILSGHTRRLAYLAEGIMETDVIRYTGMTEEQKRKYRLLANKTGEKSSWDFSLLEEELEDLDFGDFDFGFEIPEEEEEQPEIVEDEYDPEPPEEPITKPGDIWQLGDHRLMCGDSTDPETVRSLMGGGI